MAEKSALISNHGWGKKRIALAFAMLSISASACDFDISRAAKSAWDLLIGASPSPTPSPQASPSPVVPEFSSPAARASKENSELLHEVYQVVFSREPADRSSYVGLIEALNQGASLEGVYNGFTHSADYRKLEMANVGASAEALKAFGEELAVLELDLPTPTQFDSSAAQPLPTAVQPGDTTEASRGVKVIDFPSTSTSPSPANLAERYSTQFVGASIYTLKRITGDEALKVVAVKREYPEKLARWYSKWVIHMAGRKVDFGIALRNNMDEDFHYKWALSAPADRLEWEVLNRLHRVLNESNRYKQ